MAKCIGYCGNNTQTLWHAETFAVFMLH